MRSSLKRSSSSSRSCPGAPAQHGLTKRLLQVPQERDPAAPRPRNRSCSAELHAAPAEAGVAPTEASTGRRSYTSGLAPQEECGANKALVSRSCCVEARIYRLLRRQPPQARRALLTRHFTEEQRRALEFWILRQPRGPGNTCGQAAAAGGQRCNGSDSRLCSHKEPRGIKREKAESYGIQHHARGRKKLYRACVTAGPLRICTGYCDSLAETKRHLAVLLRIRARVNQRAAAAEPRAAGARSTAQVESPRGLRPQCYMPGCRQGCAQDGKLEARLREALMEEPRVAGLDASKDLRLRCFATVARLSTPSFPVAEGGDGVEAGLCAWRRLRGAVVAAQDARAATSIAAQLSSELGDSVAGSGPAWQQLREAYASVWAEAGRNPVRLEARLRRLDARFATKMAASKAPVPQRCLQVDSCDTIDSCGPTSSAFGGRSMSCACSTAFGRVISSGKGSFGVCPARVGEQLRRLLGLWTKRSQSSSRRDSKMKGLLGASISGI